MKIVFKRIFAYVVDLIILVSLVTIISNTPLINKQRNAYNKYYDELIELSEQYNNFNNDLDKYYKDKKLKEEDYQKLISDYEIYQELLNKYYEDNILKNKEYNSLKEDIQKDYENKYIKLYYNLEKNSTISYIGYLIVTILYFGIFNLITNGQTLGKKITRLKIIKNNGTKPNIINYVLRSILLYNSIYYLVSIIGSYTLNQNDFYTISNITYELEYYLQWVIIMMLLIRKDGRGLHDFIGNTKVIALDKEGNIIEEPIFSFNENPTKKESNREIKNKKKNKVIDTTIEEKE